MTLGIIGLVIGVLGVAFGVRQHFELWKWARQCQHLRVAIAYKGRVKAQYTLLEWVLWGNLMDKDKDTNGRVIYTAQSTRIALLKNFKARWTLRQYVLEMWQFVEKYLPIKKKTGEPTATSDAPIVKEGHWKGEDTPKEKQI